MLYALEAHLKDKTNIGMILQDILLSIQLEYGKAFVLESAIYQDRENISRVNETINIVLLLDLLKNADFCIFLSAMFFCEKGRVVKIETIADFVKSDSIFALLITDNQFLEIYAKNAELNERISSAVQKHVQSIEKINENQIVRTSLSVF